MQAPFPVHIQQNVEISVTRDKQAVVYMELELCICTTANNFLILQLREGRIGEIVAKRAAEWWRSKGRTDVIEFQYDQSTQVCAKQVSVANDVCLIYNRGTSSSLIRTSCSSMDRIAIMRYAEMLFLRVGRLSLKK